MVSLSPLDWILFIVPGLYVVASLVLTLFGKYMPYLRRLPPNTDRDFKIVLISGLFVLVMLVYSLPIYIFGIDKNIAHANDNISQLKHELPLHKEIMEITSNREFPTIFRTPFQTWMADNLKPFRDLEAGNNLIFNGYFGGPRFIYEFLKSIADDTLNHYRIAAVSINPDEFTGYSDSRINYQEYIDMIASRKGNSAERILVMPDSTYWMTFDALLRELNKSTPTYSSNKHVPDSFRLQELLSGLRETSPPEIKTDTQGLAAWIALSEKDSLIMKQVDHIECYVLRDSVFEKHYKKSNSSRDSFDLLAIKRNGDNIFAAFRSRDWLGGLRTEISIVDSVIDKAFERYRGLMEQGPIKISHESKSRDRGGASPTFQQ